MAPHEWGRSRLPPQQSQPPPPPLAKHPARCEDYVTRFMPTVKLTAGEYEARENILHLWFPRRVELADESAIRTFFDEVVVDWIEPCPSKPYLLVNFDNLHIRANMVEAYAQNIARFQAMLLGTFRYGMPATFTGVAVALGNLQLGAPANIFEDEHSAREAIRKREARRSRAG